MSLVHERRKWQFQRLTHAFAYAQRRESSNNNPTCNSALEHFTACSCQFATDYTERAIGTGIASWQPAYTVLSTGCNERYPFANEVRSTSTLSVVTAPSTRVAAMGESAMSREPSREPSEATIPLEAKVTKGRAWPRKQRKPSGHRHHEKDMPTRRRANSDSDGED